MGSRARAIKFLTSTGASRRRSCEELSAMLGARACWSCRLATSSAQSATRPCRVGPAGDQSDGRLPAGGRPAAARPWKPSPSSIYADPPGGAPLWQETQNVALDTKGRYALLLGATSPDGVPAAVLAAATRSGSALTFDRLGEVEGPRRSSPACPTLCVPSMPTRSAVGPLPRICSRRPRHWRWDGDDRHRRLVRAAPPARSPADAHAARWCCPAR